MASKHLSCQFENEGQRKLHVSGIRQSEVVKKLDISKATVWGWFSGSGKPGPKHRPVLSSWLQIDPLDWDVALATVGKQADPQPVTPVVPCDEGCRRLALAGMAWLARISPELGASFRAYVAESAPGDLGTFNDLAGLGESVPAKRARLTFLRALGIPTKRRAGSRG
jgi:hypothetical protein